MRLLLCLVAGLVIVTTEAGKQKTFYDKENDLCGEPKDAAIKQRLILNIVSTINKPISPVYRESHGIIDDYKLLELGILPRGEVFSLFDERNWNETLAVLDLLFEAKTFHDFIKVAEVIRFHVNEELFFYAFTVAVLHRKDTQGLQVPRVHKVFPDKFLKEPVIQKLRETNSKAKYMGRSPVVTGSVDMFNHLDINTELNYYTEDVGLNSHHYHWHTMNSPLWQDTYGGSKDRKGEFFYFMHHQMLARYDVERLSHHMARVKPFQSWNKEIKEGFDPHLTMVKTQYHYAFRPPMSILHDLHDLPKSKLSEWETRLYYAIHRGFMYDKNNTKVPLTDSDGINILANAVEANLDSVNCHLYGNIHCYAHVIAAKITDPLGAYGENSGAMYDVATSARDPLFYRWHKYINNFFVEHKKMLAPYTREELDWEDITVNRISVQGHGSSNNLIHTYWQSTLMKIPKGFAYTTDYPAIVKLKHLQHETYDYVIEVVSKASTPKLGLARIYLAPVENELGKRFTINEQRQLMIKMDTFRTKLYPGKNTIRRSSENSSVAMTSHSLFDDFEDLRDEDHCRCGWPDYLMVPRGDYDGMKFELFVTITSYEEHRVTTKTGNCMCLDGLSYCGGVDVVYPDRTPLGYPFDRKIKNQTWDDFETDNMAHTPITIQFTGEYLPPRDFFHH